MTMAEKEELTGMLRRTLADALEVMLAAAKSAHAAATHPENKPENDKDTRGLELSYLAGAQAARANEIRTALLELDAVAQRRGFAADERIGPFALVTVDETKGGRLRLFLSPHGGGLKLTLHGGEVQVVTPQSPLGDALMGKRCGDIVEVLAGRRVRELEVVAVE